VHQPRDGIAQHLERSPQVVRVLRRRQRHIRMNRRRHVVPAPAVLPGATHLALGGISRQAGDPEPVPAEQVVSREPAQDTIDLLGVAVGSPGHAMPLPSPSPGVVDGDIVDRRARDPSRRAVAVAGEPGSDRAQQRPLLVRDGPVRLGTDVEQEHAILRDDVGELGDQVVWRVVRGELRRCAGSPDVRCTLRSVDDWCHGGIEVLWRHRPDPEV